MLTMKQDYSYLRIPLTINDFSLEITPFTPEDVPGLHEIYKCPDTMKFLGGSSTLVQTKKAIANYILHCRKHPFGPTAIRDAITARIRGRTGLRIANSPQEIELFPLGDSKTQFFQLNQKVQLGYVLHPDYRRKGIATAAARAVLDYGFRTLCLEEICAFIRIENYASVCIARDKLQMELKGSFYFDNDLWYYYALNRETYLDRPE